jgi:hypothetical protein
MRSDHPTVRRFHEAQESRAAHAPQRLDASWLRQLCLERGADDARLVEISRARVPPLRRERRHAHASQGKRGSSTPAHR